MGSSTHTKMTTRSRALSKTMIDWTWAKRVFTGIGQALLGANKALQDNFLKVLGCFKKNSEAAKKSTAHAQSYEMVDQVIDGLVKGIKFIFSYPKAIMAYICKFKKNIAVWISKMFSMRRLRKYRRMMENGQSLSLSQLKAYKSAWSIKGALKSAGSYLKKGTKFVIKGFKYVGGKAWTLASKVLLPFLKKHFATLKTFLIAIRDSFFSENSFLGKLVDCGKSIGAKVMDKIKNFWAKLKAKYAAYKGIYGLGAPYVALYGFDLIFEAVCDKVVSKDLVKQSTIIIDVKEPKHTKEETVAGGNIMGTAVKFVNNAKSNVQDIINEALKKQNAGKKN